MNIYLKNIFKLIRPHQYIKNLFIFTPIFFAGQIANADLFLNALLMFIAFSLIASAVYIINDYHDIEEDRNHPKKRLRPLASGNIRKSDAMLIAIALLALGFAGTFSLSTEAFLIVLAYVIMNIGYSFVFKHIAILDVNIIAIGFVLRLFVGSVVTETSLSMWIVIMTFLLALFMALAKRRDDVLIYLESGNKMREVVDGYNLKFLDTVITIMGASVIIVYTIYTSSSEVVERANADYLYLTVLFVVFGMMRYFQYIFVLKDSGSPTQIVLKDHLLQFTLLGWGLTFAWILY